ncbi:GET complex subunit GET2-like protein [Elsinoe fawcettii]|nr:GET complex subunit GET2-like protein [Elsinoe fawcettii]
MADEAEESLAQRQARLRREKRNAKITGAGADRLAKITGVSGRAAPAPEDVPSNVARQNASADAPDPGEVDISEHHWTPESRRVPTGASSRSVTPLPTDGTNDTEADPMMRMMQQMMAGGIPGMSADGPGPNGLPADFPPFLQAMMGGQQKAKAEEQQQVKTESQYLWRILHAIFALSLASYIALTTTFNGSKLSRFEKVDPEDSVGPRLFYLFATVETLLQSSRYFLEKGQLQGSGWLATIANSGMVPEPFNGYLKVLGRYVTIWNTVVADAMVVVFVLGAIAWWRGLAAA